MQLPSRQQMKALANQVIEKGLIIVVILYISLSVSRSVMKNYQINTHIKELENKIQQLELEKNYLQSLITYYKTDTFKELKTREELGYKKEGEHVLSVPVENEQDALNATHVAARQEDSETHLPNYQKWFKYFFST